MKITVREKQLLIDKIYEEIKNSYPKTKEPTTSELNQYLTKIGKPTVTVYTKQYNEFIKTIESTFNFIEITKTLSSKKVIGVYSTNGSVCPSSPQEYINKWKIAYKENITKSLSLPTRSDIEFQVMLHQDKSVGDMYKAIIAYFTPKKK